MLPVRGLQPEPGAWACGHTTVIDAVGTMCLMGGTNAETRGLYNDVGHWHWQSTGAGENVTWSIPKTRSFN
jgi:hypothetical protein